MTTTLPALSVGDRVTVCGPHRFRKPATVESYDRIDNLMFVVYGDLPGECGWFQAENGRHVTDPQWRIVPAEGGAKPVSDGPTPHAIRLAALLYAKRMELGRDKRTMLPLRAAACLSGVTLSTFQRAEVEKEVTVENFRLICLWLGVSADEVLGTVPAAKATTP